MQLIDRNKLLKDLNNSQMGACMTDDIETARILQLVIDEVLQQPTVHALHEALQHTAREWEQHQDDNLEAGLWYAYQLLKEENRKLEG